MTRRAAGPGGAPRQWGAAGAEDPALAPLALIHTNNCSNPMPMRVPGRLADEIALYETKAQWCAENGYPLDAAEHLAYIAQLRRRAADAAKSTR